MSQFITSGTVRYYTIASEPARPAGRARAVAAAGRILRRLLAGLHESRRRQAALVIARHRHLIGDIKTTSHRDATPKNPR